MAVFEFSETRSGYRGCFENGVTSAQRMAHAWRGFHALWVNHRSEVGRQALHFQQSLFRIEGEIGDETTDERQRRRRRKSRRVLDVFHRWPLAQRQRESPSTWPRAHLRSGRCR